MQFFILWQLFWAISVKVVDLPLLHAYCRNVACEEHTILETEENLGINYFKDKYIPVLHSLLVTSKQITCCYLAICKGLVQVSGDSQESC